jgi:hypothetical protein
MRLSYMWVAAWFAVGGIWQLILWGTHAGL